jgi:hypothetical protein
MVANFKAIAKSYEYDNILEQLEHNDEFFQARAFKSGSTTQKK